MIGFIAFFSVATSTMSGLPPKISITIITTTTKQFAQHVNKFENMKFIMVSSLPFQD